MSKNQNKQAIFGGFRNQVGLQFFAGKNRMTGSHPHRDGQRGCRP